MISSAKRCFIGGEAEGTSPDSARLDTGGVLSGRGFPPAGVLRADPLAVVPGRAEAEQALGAMMERGAPAFAAVFIVDRIHLLNDCFGYAIGDRLLSAFYQRLRRRLGSSDCIYRWSGTSFVALLERRRSLAQVRGELERVAGSDAELIVRIGDGALALATAASWAVFALRGAGSKESMVGCLDHYVAANLGR